MVVTPTTTAIIKKIKEAKKTPSLTDTDLSEFVNGDRTGSPFYSIFTKDRIMNCFARVSYIPFMRGCLKSEYIRHESHEIGEYFVYFTIILYHSQC